MRRNTTATVIIPGYILFCLIIGLRKNVHASTADEKRYDRIIQAVASKYRMDGKLIHSIIRAESNYNPWAISPKGAIGLMQLMPETAAQYGVENPYDPRENIEGGVKYLRDLIKLYDGKANLVLAAYNAGQEAVKKYKGIPPYLETRNYIAKIRTSGYTRSKIQTRTTIYKFYNKKGRLVFTNDRNYFLANKGNDN